MVKGCALANYISGARDFVPSDTISTRIASPVYAMWPRACVTLHVCVCLRVYPCVCARGEGGVKYPKVKFAWVLSRASSLLFSSKIRFTDFPTRAITIFFYLHIMRCFCIDWIYGCLDVYRMYRHGIIALLVCTWRREKKIYAFFVDSLFLAHYHDFFFFKFCSLTDFWGILREFVPKICRDRSICIFLWNCNFFFFVNLQKSRRSEAKHLRGFRSMTNHERSMSWMRRKLSYFLLRVLAPFCYSFGLKSHWHL